MRADGNEPDPIDVAVGARIRIRRQFLGLSQQAVAGRLGISFQQVQKYERGVNRVSASSLVKIARVLDCSATSLMGDEQDQCEAVDAELLALLAAAGSVELLRAFAQIRDPQTRAAVIAIVRGLAAGSARVPLKVVPH